MTSWDFDNVWSILREESSLMKYGVFSLSPCPYSIDVNLKSCQLTTKNLVVIQANDINQV